MTTTQGEARVPAAAMLCPVCHWPDKGAGTCPVCGWELIGGYVAGAATPADHQAVADRLAAARQEHDVRAAVRAVNADGGGDPARLSWLAGCARGGPPSAGLVQRIAAEIEAEHARLPVALPGADYALVRLVAGETDALVIAEIGPDGISASTLTADWLGVPQRRPADGGQPWTGLLAGLPADVDLLRFRLAGGIGSAAADGHDPPTGSAAPAALGQAADAGAARALATILGAASAQARDGMTAGLRGPGPGASRARAPRLDVVLVRRTRGWPVLDAAIRRAWALARPITEIYQGATAGSLADIVDLIASRAPLRHAYDLILAEVDPRSGAVRVRPRELFPAASAARPGSSAEATVHVLPPPQAADVVEVPVVARRGDTDRDWPLVGTHFIDGTAERPTQLQIRLHGPGQLRTTAAPELLPEPATGSRWPGLLRELPKRLQPVPALDLAFLVELGGYEDVAVARRIQLVREVIGKLRATAMRKTVAQVAVMGYRDHNSKYQMRGRAAHNKLVVGTGLEPAASVLDALGSHEMWARVEVQDDYAAPLECALQVLAEDGPAWRPAARRVVVIVGSRPPHPPVPDNQGSLVRPCPEGCDWSRLVDVIRRDHDARCVAVVDDPSPANERARRYIAEAWRAFPAKDRFPLNATTPAQLVKEVGVARDGDAAGLGLALSAGTPAWPGREGGFR